MGVSMDCLCEGEKGVSRGIWGRGGVLVDRLVGWLLVLFGTEGRAGGEVQDVTKIVASRASGSYAFIS